MESRKPMQRTAAYIGLGEHGCRLCRKVTEMAVLVVAAAQNPCWTVRDANEGITRGGYTA